MGALARWVRAAHAFLPGAPRSNCFGRSMLMLVIWICTGLASRLCKTRGMLVKFVETRTWKGIGVKFCECAVLSSRSGCERNVNPLKTGTVSAFGPLFRPAIASMTNCCTRR